MPIDFEPAITGVLRELESALHDPLELAAIDAPFQVAGSYLERAVFDASPRVATFAILEEIGEIGPGAEALNVLLRGKRYGLQGDVALSLANLINGALEASKATGRPADFFVEPFLRIIEASLGIKFPDDSGVIGGARYGKDPRFK